MSKRNVCRGIGEERTDRQGWAPSALELRCIRRLRMATTSHCV